MIVVKKSHNSGFSLVELITVILLLSIIGVFALGRLGSTDVFAARGFFDDTVTAVRFAQKLAVVTGCDVQVQIAGNAYQLFQRQTDCVTGIFNRPVLSPADRSRNYTNPEPIPAGYTLTSGSITFNARGERVEATSDFNLSGGSGNFSFRVYRSTGLVEDTS